MFRVNWQHRRARVWIAELPQWCSEFEQRPDYSALRKSVVPTVRKLAGTQLAVVEVFVPRGPRADYGALGAQFVPDDTDSLVIQVPKSGLDAGNLLADSLAASSDTVRIGLPKEYSQAVLAGTLNCEALVSLGSGELTFLCAAHGEIGSSPWVFSKLACIIVQLLAWPRDIVTHATVLALLQQRLDLERYDL
jgi:hypothetical protein